MGRFRACITMRPPRFLDHVWHWRLGERAPAWSGITEPIKGLEWARLVPMAFTGFHRRYASAHGLHWGPCVLCMTLYGGHQAGGGVPDPTQPPAGPMSPAIYVGICPRCTRERNRS